MGEYETAKAERDVRQQQQQEGAHPRAQPRAQPRLSSSSWVLEISPPPRWVLLAVSLGMFIAGTYTSVMTKVMNRQSIPRYEGGPDDFFEAPWLQTLTMYVAEWTIMAVYFIDVALRKRQGKISRFEFPSSAESFAKPHCPVYWWIVPCVFDFIASTMINYAVVFAQAGIVQMLRNFNVIVTAALTCVYLRTALRIHQIYGVLLITAGLIVTGISAVLNPDTENNYADSTAVLGILMAIIGTGVSAFQFVYEERLLRKYFCSAFEAVGWMGLFGTIIGGVCLIVGQLTGFEKSSESFYQMGRGTKPANTLLFTWLSTIISIAVFNACGLSITKLATGLLRTVITTARTVSIWLICLLIKYETFDTLQLIGLILIALAVFTYNYNYVADRREGSLLDRHLRKPLLCGKLKNPDAAEDDPVLPYSKKGDSVMEPYATAEKVSPSH